ncbi:hypothetical protein [Chelatococcus asaccharovorans]|uniref:FkbM family methyltransferase n=1 Tax=Chelatococcus asaccharovorans TaxID=28210 RepID=A0A2V3UCK4_9HYPH|nr:hypothetical protein [Chelatococcus asaccharovorans]MBS7703526.1 hypothetical protein [Chelatococcus asaccharovorans]PXW61868.1 hypothetical protein C7450_103389 [Chelatococcus asaccharovorans]
MLKRILRSIGWLVGAGAADHFATRGETRDLVARIARIEQHLDRLAQLSVTQAEQAQAQRFLQEKTCAELAYLNGLMRVVSADVVNASAGHPLLGAKTNLFSQNYEDAIISAIFGRIGSGQKRFLEVGVGDGTENNTRLLLELGWRGAWVECDPAAVAAIKHRLADYLADGRLVLIEEAVTAETINDVVARCGLSGEIDFLSLDIDMNTSHVWRALSLKARVACLEYNASFPPEVEFEVAYDPQAAWQGSSYFGASLLSLDTIARQKTMALVGCDLMGINAFFVRQDLAEAHFAGPHTPAAHYQPPRYALAGARGHPRAAGRFARAGA